MTIATKGEAKRDGIEGAGYKAYVNSSNDLVGTMNPLKFFVCQHGINPSGGLDDAINGLHAAFTEAITVDANGLFSTGTDHTAPLTDGKGVATVANVVAALDTAATDDWLLVVSGQIGTTPATSMQAGFYDTLGANSTTLAVRANTANAAPGQVIDAAGNALDTAVDGGTTVAIDNDYVLALSGDISAELTSYRDKESSASIVTELGTTTMPVASIGVMSFGSLPELKLRCKSYAIGLYRFPNGTLPADWKEQSAIQGWNWANGIYMFPDSWADL